MSSKSVDSGARKNSRRKNAAIDDRSIGAFQLFLLRLGVLLLALVAWQLLATSGWLKPSVSRTPAETWEAFMRLGSNGKLLFHFRMTMSAALIALALSAVVGITIGLILALMPTVEAVFAPYISAINSMPRIALAPLFIIFFGIGQTSKVALAFSIVVFIMIVNARAGVKSADPDVLRLATVSGATKRQIFFKILIPVAIPSIFAGLRLGLIYALLGVVASELIASTSGLGQLIAAAAASFDLATVYAMLILLAIVGAVLNSVAMAVEKKLQPGRSASEFGQ